MKSLTEWNPFRELNDIQKRLSSVLAGNGENATRSDSLLGVSGADWHPAVDISEDDKEYLIVADLPEVKKEEVEVGVENGVLTIAGERKSEVEDNDEKKKFHRVERSYGRYVRTFRLPDEVDGDNIVAKFENGVLHVHLPKGGEIARQKIDIH